MDLLWAQTGWLCCCFLLHRNSTGNLGAFKHMPRSPRWHLNNPPSQGESNLSWNHVSRTQRRSTAPQDLWKWQSEFYIFRSLTRAWFRSFKQWLLVSCCEMSWLFSPLEPVCPQEKDPGSPYKWSPVNMRMAIPTQSKGPSTLMCCLQQCEKQSTGKCVRTWQGHMTLPNLTNSWICCSGTARTRRSFSVFCNSMHFFSRKLL